MIYCVNTKIFSQTAKEVGLPKQVITLASEQVEFLSDDYHEFAELSVHLPASKNEVTCRRSVALHITQCIAHDAWLC
jgi:hypothetical protein